MASGRSSARSAASSAATHIGHQRETQCGDADSGARGWRRAWHQARQDDTQAGYELPDDDAALLERLLLLLDSAFHLMYDLNSQLVSVLASGEHAGHIPRIPPPSHVRTRISD
jgi:hypothetical protein